MSFVEENVIFGFVADKRAEIFANNAMPICAVLFVELLLDMFRHEVFCFEIVDCILGLIRSTPYLFHSLSDHVGALGHLDYVFFLYRLGCHLVT